MSIKYLVLSIVLDYPDVHIRLFLEGSLLLFGPGGGLASATFLARLFHGKLESHIIHSSAMSLTFC